MLPDWVPHTFLKDLPITDEYGFVLTGTDMRNHDHPEVFAVGDAAALTVPKLGSLGHQQADIVARQLTVPTSLTLTAGSAPVGSLRSQLVVSVWRGCSSCLPSRTCTGCTNTGS